MTKIEKPLFELPDILLDQLPTGSVKTAVDRLGRMIVNGEFQEGDNIPVEAELCDILGVSRTVVREAIKVLSGKSMLRTARRYGTRVMPFETWNLLDPDVMLWHDPNSASAARIFDAGLQMRLIVEPEAARLAAQHATRAQKEQILLAASHMTPDSECAEAGMASDYAFHATILEASGNLMLAQLRGMILASLRFCQPYCDHSQDEDPHVEIAEAIADGQANVAAQLMHAMLSRTISMAKTAA